MKLDISKEWCLAAADREGDSEVGAGLVAMDPSFEMERTGEIEMVGEKNASWFWYGRFEGAYGGYAPPQGRLAAGLYWIGNLVGRLLGPPKNSL